MRTVRLAIYDKDRCCKYDSGDMVADVQAQTIVLEGRPFLVPGDCLEATIDGEVESLEIDGYRRLRAVEV